MFIEGMATGSSLLFQERALYHEHMGCAIWTGWVIKIKTTKFGGGILGRVRWKLKERRRNGYDHIVLYACMNKENLKIKMSSKFETTVLYQEAK